MKLKKAKVDDDDDDVVEDVGSDDMDAKAKGGAFVSNAEQNALVDAVIEAYNEPKAEQARAEAKEAKEADEKSKAKKSKESKGKDSAEVTAEVTAEPVVKLATDEDEKKVDDSSVKERDFDKELGFGRKAVVRIFKKKMKGLPSDALDIALFGRMVASEASLEADSAVHVAYDFTTHRCSTCSDNFTVKEEFMPKSGLMPKEQRGASHMGNVSLVSGCFYGSRVIDVDRLFKNYPVEDAEKRRTILVSAVESAIMGVPTAGQSSTNTRELPGYILAYVCEGQEQTMADAFTARVHAEDGGGFMEPSIVRLEKRFESAKADAKSMQFDTLGIKDDFRYRQGAVGGLLLGEFVAKACDAALK
jgi:hypothetical protein